MKLLKLVTTVNNTVKFNRGIKHYPKESHGKLIKPVTYSIYMSGPIGLLHSKCFSFVPL